MAWFVLIKAFHKAVKATNVLKSASTSLIQSLSNRVNKLSGAYILGFVTLAAPFSQRGLVLIPLFKGVAGIVLSLRFLLVMLKSFCWCDDDVAVVALPTGKRKGQFMMMANVMITIFPAAFPFQYE